MNEQELQESSQGKKNILVLEDDPEMNKFYTRILGEKYNLLIAVEANEARKKLDENKIDLIILDIMLPGEPGDHFLLELKKDPRYSSIDVLIVSILRDNGVSVKKTFPDVVFISKPFERDALLGVIEDKINKKDPLDKMGEGR